MPTPETPRFIQLIQAVAALLGGPGGGYAAYTMFMAGQYWTAAFWILFAVAAVVWGATTLWGRPVF